MDRNKIISAVVLGAAVTAALGLLIASDKGKSAVKNIAERKNVWKESAVEGVVNFLFTMIDKLTSDKYESSEKPISKMSRQQEREPA